MQHSLSSSIWTRGFHFIPCASCWSFVLHGCFLLTSSLSPLPGFLYPAVLHSSGVRSLEALCLQVTDLLPGLRRMRAVLPEHGCLLVSPGNYWQNQQDLFDSDPDLMKTVQKHEPKGLHTSATLRGERARETKRHKKGWKVRRRGWKWKWREAGRGRKREREREGGREGEITSFSETIGTLVRQQLNVSFLPHTSIEITGRKCIPH